MEFLLDSNSCINVLRRGANSPVAKRIAAVVPPDSVCLCSIVVGELLFGARRSQDVLKNLAKVHAFAAKFPTLPCDDRVADEYGIVRAERTAKGMLIGPNACGLPQPHLQLAPR